jgi:hypothetical protein
MIPNDSKNSGSAPRESPASEALNNLGQEMNFQISPPSLKKIKFNEERFLEGQELEELLKKEVMVQELEGNPIGSLRRHLSSWEEQGCSPTTIMWVRHGTPLFFKQLPPSGGGRRNYVPIAAMKFANEELTRLWVVNAIEKDDGQGEGYTFPVGAVPKPHESNKWRMICDITDHGQGPNNFMPDKPFRMEQIDDLLNQMGRGWWGLTFDLRSGFHHLDVHPDFRKWLRFVWAGELFHFNAMPFGPKHSPWIFNKVVREFVLILRRGCTRSNCNHQMCRFRAAPNGVTVAPFVDDFCVAAASREILLRIREEILVPLMTEMGWIRALGKGSWEPAQKFDFLGLTIDTVKGKVFIPEVKLKRYCLNLSNVLSKTHAPVRELASVAGKIVSVMRAFAPALMFLRATFALIATVTDGARGWGSTVELTQEAREDLVWLKDHLRSSNGRFAWRPAQISILATDAASTVGWGATLKTPSDSKVQRAQGNWSTTDKEQDIYILEMRAILNGVRSFSEKLRGCRIQILTDNMICRHTLPNGSRIPELRVLIKEIQHLVMSLDTTIVDVAWIPSELNVIPDQLSRLVDTNDWEVTDETWQSIRAKWPTMQIDRFASNENAKLPRFNTRFAHPTCQDYNCMAQDWTQGGLSYACPPLAMVGQVVQLISQQRTSAILIVPNWPQQPWWPKLQAMTKDRLSLGSGKNAFKPGLSGQCSPWKNEAWTFLAVEVQGNGP